jgi:SAM-dependent methyltransferase
VPKTDQESRALLELPFDQYQRYRLVSDAVAVLRRDGGPVDVLDVGGHPGHLARFLPQDTVVVADPLACPIPRAVRADGLSLPFRQGAFDGVVSVDVLEHLPCGAREAFISELSRVARGWLLLAAPLASPQAREAERLLAAFIRCHLGVEHRPLAEHLAHDPPREEEVAAWLDNLGWRHEALPNGYLHRWLPLMMACFWLQSTPAMAEVSAALQRYYNQHYYHDDNRYPAYRTLFVATRQALDGARAGRLRALERPAELDTPHGRPLDLGPASLLLSLLTAGRIADKEAALARAHREVEMLRARLAERESEAEHLLRHVDVLLKERRSWESSPVTLLLVRMPARALRTLAPRLFRRLRSAYRRVRGLGE